MKAATLPIVNDHVITLMRPWCTRTESVSVWCIQHRSALALMGQKGPPKPGKFALPLYIFVTRIQSPMKMQWGEFFKGNLACRRFMVPSKLEIPNVRRRSKLQFYTTPYIVGRCISSSQNMCLYQICDRHDSHRRMNMEMVDLIFAYTRLSFTFLISFFINVDNRRVVTWHRTTTNTANASDWTCVYAHPSCQDVTIAWGPFQKRIWALNSTSS